jgi:hypothetical protein
MAKVLTEQSKISCGHSGTVSPTGVQRLKVGGKAVLTKTVVEGASVSTCATVPSKDQSGTDVDMTCTKVTSVTGTESAKLKVGTKQRSAGVLVDPLSGATDGLVSKAPAMALTAEPVQERLSAG